MLTVNYNVVENLFIDSTFINYDCNLTNTEDFSYFAHNTTSVVLTLFGIYTSFLNVIVFRGKLMRKKSTTLDYLLVMCINDFLYLIALLIWMIWNSNNWTTLGSVCQFVQYFRLVYFIGIFTFLTSSMAIFNLFLEIYITLERFFILKNKSYFKNYRVMYVVLALSLVSILFYMPVLFLTQIVSCNNNKNSNSSASAYRLQVTRFGNSNVGKLTAITLFTIRHIIITAVLFILNLITIFEFKNYQAKKRRAKSIYTSYQSLTPMLIYLSLLYVLSNMPYMIYYFVEHIFPEIRFLYFLDAASIISLYTLIPLKFFIYFFFNKLFRKQVFIYLNSFKCTFKNSFKCKCTNSHLSIHVPQYS